MNTIATLIGASIEAAGALQFAANIIDQCGAVRTATELRARAEKLVAAILAVDPQTVLDGVAVSRADSVIEQARSAS
jgi:hypothetical protein